MPADSARFPTVWQLLCAKTILSSCLAWMSSAAQFDPWYACCTHQTTELLLVQLWCSCNAFGVTPRNLAFPPGKIIGIDSVFLAKCLLTQPAFRLSGNCFAPKQFFRLVSLGCLPRHNLIPGMLAALIKPPNSFLFNCGVPATLSKVTYVA